jgi:signal transduction histidine kinase
MTRNRLVLGVLILILACVLIGGFFNQTQQISQKESVKSLVTEAAELILTDGEAAFAQFRVEGSHWFQGDIYIFVWQTDGLRLVYPPDVNGEGQNMTSLLDVTGKPIGQLFINAALSETGEGWVDYQWPKPGETMPSVKHTFIKGVELDDKVLLVGSGLYGEDYEVVVAPLQYVAVVVEGVIAALGLMLAVKKKRFFGYGIFLTFGIYVFYDLVRLTSTEISNAVMYPVFFVATLSMLWVAVLIYRERKSVS